MCGRVVSELEWNEGLFAIVGQGSVEIFLVFLCECIVKFSAPSVIVNFKNSLILARQVAVKVLTIFNVIIFFCTTLCHHCANLEHCNDQPG